MSYVIYDDYVNADIDNLTYKIISRSLIKPTINLILTSIFDDENCDEIQSANNIIVLEYIETTVSNYVFNYEFNLDFIINSDYECKCKAECQCEDKVNITVRESFKKAKKQFDFNLHTDRIFDYIDAESTDTEFTRLRNLAYPIFGILLSRELGRWAFYNGLYEAGFNNNSSATLLYGCTVGHLRIDLDKHITTEISDRNKKASDARWQVHREERKERKKKYLKIMKEQGFSTYTDAATYIKQHIDTDNKPSHPTVSRLLSEADKGDFS